MSPRNLWVLSTWLKQTRTVNKRKLDRKGVMVNKIKKKEKRIENQGLDAFDCKAINLVDVEPMERV